MTDKEALKVFEVYDFNGGATDIVSQKLIEVILSREGYTTRYTTVSARGIQNGFIYTEPCLEKGFSWERIIGPSEMYEINRTETFKIDILDYGISYQAYLLYLINKEYSAEYSFDDLAECLREMSDIECEFPHIAEYLYEYSDANSTQLEQVIQYIVLGAEYFSLLLDGNASVKTIEDRLNSAGKVVHCYAGYNYFDRITKEIYTRAGVEDKEQELISLLLPYWLDVFFSTKNCTGDYGGTCKLYWFYSRNLKAYKEIKEKVPEHPYYKYMDKLVPILEDPFMLSTIENVPSPRNVIFMDEIRTSFAYLSDYYVAVYYGFDCCEYMNMSGEAFTMARVCFDALYNGLIAQVAL